MLAGIASWFDSSVFMPHGLCLLWQPGLLALHVTTDVLIGLSYFSIPVALVYFVRRRRDLAFGWVFRLFAAFILACGTTHFVNVWTLWTPDYGVEGMIKAATAAVSVLTAISLWVLMPRALALPSPAQLADANAALHREIAERRAAEDRYVGFFKNLAEGLFVVAPREDGRFEFVTINPALAVATGLDPAHVSGRLLADALPADSAQVMLRHCEACVAQGDVVDFEDTLDLPVGRRVWHSVLVPVRGPTGAVIQLLGSCRDITERRRLRDELVQASKLATLGTLAAGMAHEMSQPLNVVRIWTENALSRLRDGALDPARLEKVLTLVAEQTVRMGSIIDHMRTFSRRDRSGTELFDPAGCVRAAVDLVSHQYAVEDIAVDLQLDAGGAVPVAVRGRPVQLEQVVLNLLSNARDAIRGNGTAGHIAVACRMTGDGDAVEISVTDDGGGIPDASLTRIFDPFFTTKEVGQGTGLGLSIGYGIVDAMGGRIAATNITHPDGRRGVRFTITLPLARPQQTEVEHAHA